MLGKPTLKFFALTRIGRLSIYGSLWKAVDRRNSGVEFVLFAPNYLRNWVRYSSLFEEYLIRPVKLRSGRVAILLQNSSNLKQMRKLVRPQFLIKHSFTPSGGFVSAKRGFKMKYVLTCFGFLGLAMFNVPHLQSKALDSPAKHQPICSYSVEAGSLLKREGSGRFTVAGKSIQVKSVGSFGGLSELSVMRICDRKKYEIRAWRTKLGYVVSKVD